MKIVLDLKVNLGEGRLGDLKLEFDFAKNFKSKFILTSDVKPIENNNLVKLINEINYNILQLAFDVTISGSYNEEIIDSMSKWIDLKADKTKTVLDTDNRRRIEKYGTKRESFYYVTSYESVKHFKLLRSGVNYSDVYGIEFEFETSFKFYVLCPKEKAIIRHNIDKALLEVITLYNFNNIQDIDYFVNIESY